MDTSSTPVSPSLLDEPLMNAVDIAGQFGVKQSWVLDQWQAGRLPGFRLGEARGPVRFRPSEVSAWLESRRRGPTPLALERAA